MKASKNITFWGALILIMLFQFKVEAQGWNQVYSETQNSLGYTVIQTLDGGYAFAGTVLSPGGTSWQLSITKTDFLGNTQWMSSFGDTSQYLEAAYDLKMTTDGGYIACGSREISSSENRVFVVRVDAFGDLVWEKEYGNSNTNQSAFSVLPTPDEGFLLCGFTDGWSANMTDILLMKIDSLGNSIWVNTYGSNDNEKGRKIVRTPDGGYAISGITYIQGIQSSSNSYVIKLDANFNEEWSNTYGGAEYDITSDMEVFANGDYLLSGYTSSFGVGGTQVFLIRIDPNGTILWENIYGNNNHMDGIKSDLTTDEGIIISGTSADGAGEWLSFLLKVDGSGNQQFLINNEVWYSSFGLDVQQTADGGYIQTGTVLQVGGEYSFLVKTDSLGNMYTNRLQGNIFNDLDLSCDLETGEEGIEQIIIMAESDNLSFYSASDANGDYEMRVDTGLYDVTAISPNSLWTTCNSPFQIDVNTFYTDYAEDIPFQLEGACPYMMVDISTPILRPCMQSSYTVNYANYGAPLLQSGSIEIEFDSLLTIISSSLPWTSQAGNIYTFDIGLLNSFENGSFTVLTELDCDTAIVGMTHCAIAHIFPDTICAPPNPLWDGSSLEITADCIGDSTIFNVTNTGTGNMNNGGNYLVIEDQLMLTQGMVLLQAGQDTSFVFYPNGKTIRFEVKQSVGHPGSSNPSVTIEGCGNGPLSTGFVTMYPENDGNPFVSIDCRESVASFDPNDKMAIPKGYGTEHFIEANTDLEYKIRFQNTGTDTAFYVEVIDTLSQLLAPETILPGSSSYPYEFEMFGNGIIRFIFRDIELPHEGIDEPGSHGFVKFKISQDLNNPIGSEIFNSAAIYFDFNAPIITNITEHRIGEDFIEVFTDVKNNGSESEVVSLKVFPNPFEQSATFEMEGTEYKQCQFELMNVSGQALRQKSFTGNRFEFRRKDLPSGMYFYRISSEGAILSTGKIMIR